MRERFADTGNKAKNFWGSLKGWQKISLVVAAVVAFGAVASLAFVAGRPSYEPLFFQPISQKDQAKVVNYLNEKKIPYKSDMAADMIYVPGDKVYEARLALASQNIPQGGSQGYELFDPANKTVINNDFDQKMSYKMAIEGELSRTVQSINGIESARVSIVEPESKLFLEQQQDSTASVLVGLTPGFTLRAEQIQAIMNLVSRSVKQLPIENVTVVDREGNNLSARVLDDNYVETGENTAILKSTQAERQQEMYLEKKIRQMLEKVYGPGKVEVKATVRMDFDKRQESRKDYVPYADTGKGIQRSIKTTEENYTGPVGFYGGPPGTTTNIPGYVVNSGMGQGNAEYSRTESVINYDITTVDQQRIVNPDIRRITASVLIDGKLPKTEIDTVRSTVASAIGFDSVRGDEISVVAMPFDTSIADALRERLQAEQRQRLIIGISSFVLLLLACGIALFMWLRHRRRVAEMEARRAAQASADQAPSLRELLENPDLMTNQGELSVLEEQLRNYAINNPEELASLIKNWIVEDV